MLGVGAFAMIQTLICLLSWAPQPPPPVKVLEEPVTPQRIVVGSLRQAIYIGPGAAWVNGNRLSEAESANDERIVASHPDDIRARGALIAYGVEPWPTRLTHVLWMIEHHPDWGGFSLDPTRSLAPPEISDWFVSDDNNLLRTAWLQQVSAGPQRAVVLHNAAMFFAVREPQLAADLLRQAMLTEPGEPLYVERQGMVYAYSLAGPERLRRFGVSPSPERDAFAQQAREVLAASSEWLLILGAADAMAPSFNRGNLGLDEEAKELRARAKALSPMGGLPSHTLQYMNGIPSSAPR